MRRIKQMMATAMLAMVVLMGTQTAFAGIYLSDRQAGDPTQVSNPTDEIDFISLLVGYCRTGVYLSTRTGVMLSD